MTALDVVVEAVEEDEPDVDVVRLVITGLDDLDVVWAIDPAARAAATPNTYSGNMLMCFAICFTMTDG